MMELRDREGEGSSLGYTGAMGQPGLEHEQQGQLACALRIQGKASPMCNFNYKF